MPTQDARQRSAPHAPDPKCAEDAGAALGPRPREALGALLDYGLNDADIGRYFGLAQDTVAALRRTWGLTGRA